MLTSNLILEVEKANAALARWVEQKSDRLETSYISYQQRAEECVCTISALKGNEIQLEKAREYQEFVKQQQKLQLQEQSNFIQDLLSRKKETLLKLQSCEKEEDKENARLNHAQVELESLHKKIDASINKLSQGMSKFSFLGLEFQRSRGECMDFIFTQIDPRDHNRSFTFTMFVDSNDVYNLVSTSPLVEPQYCDAVLKQLNNDNDIKKFVIAMRKAFVRIAVKI